MRKHPWLVDVTFVVAAGALIAGGMQYPSQAATPGVSSAQAWAEYHAAAPITPSRYTWPTFHYSGNRQGYNPAAVSIDSGNAGSISATPLHMLLTPPNTRIAAFSSAPVIDHPSVSAASVLFVATAETNMLSAVHTGKIYKLNADTLALDPSWGVNPIDLGQDVVTSPAIYSISRKNTSNPRLRGAAMLYQGTLNSNPGPSYFYGINAATGVVQWRAPINVDVQSSPVTHYAPALNGVSTAGDDRVYLGTAGDSKGEVLSLDAATGAQKWVFPLPIYHGVQARVWGPLAVADMLTQVGSRWLTTSYIFFASSDNKALTNHNDDAVYCLRAADGALVWRHQLNNNPDRDTGAGPLVYVAPSGHDTESHVYVGNKASKTETGRFFDLMAANGHNNPAWNHGQPTALHAGKVTIDSIVTSSATLVKIDPTGTGLAAYRLYVGSDHGILYRINPVNGVIEQYLALGSVYAPIYASPTASGNAGQAVLYISAGNTMYVVNPGTLHTSMARVNALGNLSPAHFSQPVGASATVVDLRASGLGRIYFGIGYPYAAMGRDFAKVTPGNPYFVAYGLRG